MQVSRRSWHYRWLSFLTYFFDALYIDESNFSSCLYWWYIFAGTLRFVFTLAILSSLVYVFILFLLPILIGIVITLVFIIVWAVVAALPELLRSSSLPDEDKQKKRFCGRVLFTD